jgi:diacylglycerol kinase family enzyme
MVLWQLGRVLGGAERLRGKNLLQRDDVPHIRVTCETPVRVQVDGDLVGERTGVDFYSVPDALQVAL